MNSSTSNFEVNVARGGGMRNIIGEFWDGEPPPTVLCLTSSLNSALSYTHLVLMTDLPMLCF